jgi:hypothetical protein
MSDFIVPPNPEVKISSLDFEHLPLVNFHIVAVVEPDPESWMPNLGDDDNLEAALEVYTQMVSDELYPDFDLSSLAVEVAKDVAYPRVIWVGGGAVSFYYEDIADVYAKVAFTFDFEEYEDLRFYIKGVTQEHPNWRVAVLGAMFEDDVIRVANVIQEAGLDTTVIARYCLSSKAFVNLDDLFALRNELRRKGLLDNFGL